MQHYKGACDSVNGAMLRCPVGPNLVPMDEGVCGCKQGRRVGTDRYCGRERWVHGDVKHNGDSVSFTFTLNKSKSWDFAEAVAEGGGGRGCEW